MAFNPTFAQNTAINAKGNILVAAAAGSGKTAVLVERVIKKLCDEKEGISADRLLIVTFTNAAAAEMRSRIEKRLDEECRKNPQSAALRLQKHLLKSANICTIDSFCINLVRENFELAGVSPDFKMSGGDDLTVINQRVANKLFSRYLEEGSKEFYQLLDIIGTEYDHKSFLSFILSVYNFTRQMPFPDEWFDKIPEFYGEGEFKADNPCWNYAFKRAEDNLKEHISALYNALPLLEVSQEGAEKLRPCFTNGIELLNELLKTASHNNWDEFYNRLNCFSLLELPSVKDKKIFEVSAAINIYNHISAKGLEGLKKMFYADKAFIDSQFAYIYKPMCLLRDIMKELQNELFEEYKQINTFTFHNTEHLALNLLCEKDNEGNLKIKAGARELLNRFDEVMVDEYQDTNDLQDMLFYVLSNREKKLFVVGDVKQSIYAFRGANPKNFLNKKNRYIPISKATDDLPQKVILGNNFRTKPEVCEFINFFFENFLNEHTGSIVYNDEEKLIPSAIYPETSDIPTELKIIDCKGSELSSIETEAHAIADYIKKTMAEGKVIRENGEALREARFSDFAVLLRSANNSAPIIAKILKQHNIPVSSSKEDSSLKTEVSTFLNLLSVIDNPNSDIELLSLLMSPIFGFSSEDLALMRIEKRSGSLYSALIKASKTDKKAEEFLEKIEYYRLLSVTNSLPSLINLLFNETGILNIAASFNDGIKRRNNLLALIGYAEQAVREGRDSIGYFVKYIKNLSEKGIKSAGSSLSGDGVKLMSIHGSKGLQFPITIIATTAPRFNDDEARSSFDCSTDFGLGFKYFDEKARVKYTTIGKEVMLNRTRTERLEEELRLLYVAMTRAQDRLVFIGALTNLENKVNTLKELLISSGNTVNSVFFGRTKSYFEWLVGALLLHPAGRELRDGCAIISKETESQIKLSVLNADDIPKPYNEVKTEMPSPDTQKAELIKQNIGFVYPFRDILDIEAKASVSKLANSAEAAKFAFKDSPAFLNKGGITAAQRGTAMHKVMEYFDFSKWQNIEEELNRLYEWQFISETELEAISIDSLKAFFESDVFNRILNARLVKREMRFLTEIDALDIVPTLDKSYNSEKVIVQGAVDVCFIEDDGIVILDFKTDRVDDANLLKEAYGEQLNIYSIACEKIFKKTVKQKIIYSFSKQAEVII